jgi:hypothetical protein
MFSQFRPKATKNRSNGDFSFTRRESQLLEKKTVFWIQPFGLTFDFEDKTQSQTHPKRNEAARLSTRVVDATISIYGILRACLAQLQLLILSEDL